MSHTTRIIKAGGRRQSESFSLEKLHNSITATCLAARSGEGHAEQIAHHVAIAVADWCSTRYEATSDDIRHVAARTLSVHHPEAAFLYTQQPYLI